ncbi:MAG TPA: flagellar basal body protein [Acidimicrobiales bacterium]|jgi:flagellar basal-body rod protein FlgB|nr:flagellar basal body protein [Acidimicrobiales bacterium]
MEPTIDVLHAALNGLMARQSVIANNIANASTPGFKASQVSFEAALRQAMQAGTAPATDPSVVSPTMAAPNQDGNNVNLEGETLSLAETELRYQAMVDAVNGQFQVLNTSIQG